MEFLWLVLAVAGLCVFAASKNVGARVGGLFCASVFGLLWLFTACAIIIPPGHAGVVFNRMTGIERGVLREGFHIIVPFLQTVYDHDVRTQSESFEGEEAVSSDQQVVHTDVTVNFHPRVEELPLLYQEVGFDYTRKIVTPVVREALKAEVAKHPVDKLLANREQVSQSIRDYVSHKLGERHIDMELISLTNLKFSSEYQAAVEAKQVALQQAEAKRNELQKAKVEADITRTQADAEAYKITATNKALGSSPEYIKLEAIRKINPNAQIIYVPHGGSILIPGGLTGEKR
ncbi:MAG TPA: SPFH domain-containing protein [Candidatus Obscuribacterales bacterium]